MCSDTEKQLELVISDVRREIDCYLMNPVSELVLLSLSSMILSSRDKYFSSNRFFVN